MDPSRRSPFDFLRHFENVECALGAVDPAQEQDSKLAFIKGQRRGKICEDLGTILSPHLVQIFLAISSKLSHLPKTFWGHTDYGGGRPTKE
jgi:hypothetical protein